MEKCSADLDFVKIKQDLMNSANEKKQIYILQALRWRLTKAETRIEREKILAEYVKADLLNCRQEHQLTSIIGLLNSKNEVIVEFMARLINTFASLNLGKN